MPRIRSLKPEIASDAKLARVSRDARYTFVLMITQADDHGLLAGAHRQLLGALYPLDDDVTVGLLLGWIEELVGIGLVRWRETRDHVPIVELVNWSKHQRISNAGRSQLGALIAESPVEPRGNSPNLAANRGEPPLGPRTLDLGPPITDQMSAAVRLSCAANQGLTDHATRPQLIPRIIATAARTQQAAEEIVAAGVPLEFAERAIYDLAKEHNAEGEVRSLGYFAPGVLRAWQVEQAGGHAAAKGRPAARVAAEDVAAKVRVAHGHVELRRQKEDGPEWWGEIQEQARAHGAATDRDVLLYAYQQLQGAA